MEVKILQGVTPFEIELRANEFLARTPYQVVDIKFSMSLGPYGHSERFNSDAEYSTMIVYDEST